jgi:hypothetical protein
MQTRDEWIADTVVTRDGRVVPVRATARCPHWADLPASAREAITVRLSAEVISTTSTGIGFTPGFASRPTLRMGDACSSRRPRPPTMPDPDGGCRGLSRRNPQAARAARRPARSCAAVDCRRRHCSYAVGDPVFRVRRRGASTSTLAAGRTAPGHRRVGPARIVSCGGTVSRSSPKNSPRSRPG